MEASGQFHATTALNTGKRSPGTKGTGGWVGPKPFYRQWRREKILAPAGNRNLVVQPIV